MDVQGVGVPLLLLNYKRDTLIEQSGNQIRKSTIINNHLPPESVRAELGDRKQYINDGLKDQTEEFIFHHKQIDFTFLRKIKPGNLGFN